MSTVMDLRGRHLLRLADFSPEEITYLIELAAELKAVLGRPAAWCDVMMMQTNVKRCSVGEQGKALSVGFVRKSEQTADDAQVIEFQLAANTAAPDYLALKMSAERGPVGTSNYSLAIEAAPLDAQRSFLHMSYAYSNGLSARIATDAYLATSGRNKVGFSIVGHDQAVPRYAAAVRALIAEYRMLPDRFWFTGPVPEAELAAYYRNAHAYVSLSEHEGFCVPLVESMAMDVPVLAYAAAAVPETLGGAGVTFAPKDLEYAAELLGGLIYDQPFRSGVLAGRRRVSRAGRQELRRVRHGLSQHPARRGRHRGCLSPADVARSAPGQPHPARCAPLREHRGRNGQPGCHPK